MASYFRSRKNKNLLISFLAGTAVGTGLALLTAPKSGRELRGQISDMTDESMEKMKGYASDAQTRIMDTLESGKRVFNEKKVVVTSAFRRGKDAMAEERERQHGEASSGYERSAI